MAEQFVSSLDDLWNRGEKTGLARGLAQGRAEGRAEMLRDQLELKFGPLPEWVEDRLKTASAERLALYAKRVLTETSLEATLAEP
ncbi:MAG: hypothetical protein R3B07_06805 [Polyangiaceae bacterium]